MANKNMTFNSVDLMPYTTKVNAIGSSTQRWKIDATQLTGALSIDKNGNNLTLTYDEDNDQWVLTSSDEGGSADEEVVISSVEPAALTCKIWIKTSN